MELNTQQKELVEALAEKGLSRTDIFSVMLVLNREDKAEQMIAFLQGNPHLTVDEICEKAGKIAFGENA